jgi:hypothetical protein
MIETELSMAVEGFANLTHKLSDDDLERHWVWGDYDEGVRFAFFRTYEQIRQLASRLGAEREASGVPMTTAQRILGQYHLAYRDLQAKLIGVDDEFGERNPEEGEWPLRKILQHIIGAERGFFATTFYAIERIRVGDDRPMAMSDDDWNAFWEDDDYKQLSEGGHFSEILSYYQALHARILTGFSNITDDELGIPSVFWESDPMPVVFRLHRFDSHLRQHTIQAEKTLHKLVGVPTESQRLLRLIYAALGEVEGIAIGDVTFAKVEMEGLAEVIAKRTDEIGKILA